MTLVTKDESVRTCKFEHMMKRKKGISIKGKSFDFALLEPKAFLKSYVFFNIINMLTEDIFVCETNWQTLIFRLIWTKKKIR